MKPGIHGYHVRGIENYPFTYKSYYSILLFSFTSYGNNVGNVIIYSRSGDDEQFIPPSTPHTEGERKLSHKF